MELTRQAEVENQGQGKSRPGFLAILADQQLTVRETPAHEVERRIAEYRRKMRSL